MDILVDRLESTLKAEMGVDTLGFMVRLAAGRITESPFPHHVVDEVRGQIANFFNIPAQDCEAQDGQCFRLSLIAGILKALRDPDADYVKSLERGVPLGVDGAMP